MKSNITLISLIFIIITAVQLQAAEDNADNDPYPLSGFLPGDNGGSGFDAWLELDSGTPGSMFTTAAIDEGSYSWGISGTYALGRGLSTPQAAGSWSLLAQHDRDTTHFSGFNLRSSADAGTGFADSELLRFGLAADQIGYDGTGIYVSTNAGLDYSFLDCGWVDGRDDVLGYDVQWNNGTYTLSVSNVTEGLFSQFSGNLASSSDVAALGVGLTGNTLNETLTFDSFAVIPEPSVFAFLIAFAGLLIIKIGKF